MRSTKGDLSFDLLGQKLVLLPERCLFWEERSILMVADLHLGKAGHFRKAGIPISRAVHETEWELLTNLVLWFNPQTVLILGDLFHSAANSEWEIINSWLTSHPGLRVELVVGNHDVHSLAASKGLFASFA